MAKDKKTARKPKKTPKSVEILEDSQEETGVKTPGTTKEETTPKVEETTPKTDGGGTDNKETKVEETVKSDSTHKNLDDAIEALTNVLDLKVVGRLNESIISAKQFGLLRILNAELGKPEGFTFNEFEKAFVKAGLHKPNVSHLGYIDWKFGLDAREAYASIVALVQMRENGTIIHKSNIRENITGGFSDLGERIFSVI